MFNVNHQVISDSQVQLIGDLNIEEDQVPRYPMKEMTCTSKISCLSWNIKEKSLLASSDYEGCVTLWDVNTGNEVVKFDVSISINLLGT